MAVSNGQVANATTFNTAFTSRTVDDNTVGRKDFQNTNPASGGDIINGQREWNKLNSFLGSTPNTAFDSLPSWTNNDVGSATDTVKDRADNLTAEFDPALGHNHDGTAGSGGPISAGTLDDFNNYFAEFQTTIFTSPGGLSDDVTSAFSSFTPGGDVSTEGVVTTVTHNKCELREDPSGDQIETGGGEKVYARLTESAGTWTLTYYYLDSGGVETAYSLPAQDIRIFFKQVFTAETRPTFPSDVGDIGSFDATADIIDASVTESGLVNTTAQSFAGLKTLTEGADFSEAISTEGATVAGGGTITALSSTTSLVYISGAGATSIQGAVAGRDGQILVIHNLSSGSVTVYDQDAGASSSNRFKLPNGDDVTIDSDSSAEFFYEISGMRWKLRAGSGTGSGAVGTQESIGTGDGSTTTFGPLTFVPLSEDSINVFVNGLIVDTADWSLSGVNIVFGIAPAAAADIYVSYLTNGSPAMPVLPSGTFQSYWHTISGGEETAKQFTISPTPATPSQVVVDVKGGGPQVMGDDFTISGSTFDWSGFDLDGVLASGDKVRLVYTT